MKTGNYIPLSSIYGAKIVNIAKLSKKSGDNQLKNIVRPKKREDSSTSISMPVWWFRVNGLSSDTNKKHRGLPCGSPCGYSSINAYLISQQ